MAGINDAVSAVRAFFERAASFKEVPIDDLPSKDRTRIDGAIEADNTNRSGADRGTDLRSEPLVRHGDGETEYLFNADTYDGKPRGYAVLCQSNSGQCTVSAQDKSVKWGQSECGPVIEEVKDTGEPRKTVFQANPNRAIKP